MIDFLIFILERTDNAAKQVEKNPAGFAIVLANAFIVGILFAKVWL